MSEGTQEEGVKSSVVVDRLDYIARILRGKDTKNVRWAGNQHTPNTDRTINTTRTKLNISGTLTIFKIIVLSGSVARDLYVRVSLEDENQNFKGDICYGYIETSKSPHGAGGLVVEVGDFIRVDSWGYVSCIIQPIGTILQDKQVAGGWSGTNEGSLDGQGKSRVLQATQPAAGATVTITVPTGARWALKSLQVTYTTSGTTATRTLNIRYTDVVIGAYLRMIAGLTQTASVTNRQYHFSKSPVRDTSVQGGAFVQIPISEQDLIAGQTIVVDAENLGLSDQLSAVQYHISDWIEI